MVALNLDAAFGDRATGTALLLQFGRERIELVRSETEPRNHGHTFALATLSFATDAHDTVARCFAWRALFAYACLNGAQTVRATLTHVSRVNDSAAVGGAIPI